MLGVWSRLMRDLFDNFDFAVVYLDFICIFSKTTANHKVHQWQVFQALRHEKGMRSAAGAPLESTVCIS